MNDPFSQCLNITWAHRCLLHQTLKSLVIHLKCVVSFTSAPLVCALVLQVGNLGSDHHLTQTARRQASPTLSEKELAHIDRFVERAIHISM